MRDRLIESAFSCSSQPLDLLEEWTVGLPIQGNSDIVACFLGAPLLCEIKQIVDKTLLHLGLSEIDSGKDVCLVCDIDVDKHANVDFKIPFVLPFL